RGSPTRPRLQDLRQPRRSACERHRWDPVTRDCRAAGGHHIVAEQRAELEPQVVASTTGYGDNPAARLPPRGHYRVRLRSVRAPARSLPETAERSAVSGPAADLVA